jgi:hypothetical protein
MARKPALVTKFALEQNCSAHWNAFIELLSTPEHEDLSAVQRAAYLVLRYESEVQNGGHLQYLTNCSLSQVHEAAIALRHMHGGSTYGRVLEQALIRWRSATRLSPANTLEFVAIALEGEFEDLDDAFHACQAETPLVKVLERYFAAHEPDFIVRE